MLWCPKCELWMREPCAMHRTRVSRLAAWVASWVRWFGAWE